MTMDIAQQEREDMKMLSPRLNCDLPGKSESIIPPHTKTSVKRSFDVAFLMLPDEKLKNKQAKQQRLSPDAIVTYPQQINVRSDESLRKLCERRTEFFNGNQLKHCAQNILQLNNNNNIDSMKNGRFTAHDIAFISQDLSNRMQEAPPKSAFTKVPHIRQQPESPIPTPSISPEQLSCPSASPPISTSPPQNPLYQHFRSEYQFMNGNPFQSTINQMQMKGKTNCEYVVF